ncbi:MAG: hypothetical protein P4K83_02075 [Terracidiphilus sp.]|nr:hypothetical protein [Terracidiphilus sp.]
MPATDILNETSNWEQKIQDSMCPDYGFSRKRSSTRLNQKAVGGVPWTRETQNTGHTFPLSWNNRSWACVQRLKRYFEQYEDGFFTIIDHDGGGRHYVGRFTGEFPLVQSGNGMWNVQNLLFEEMPQVAMVKYPSDWAHDSIRFYALNDFGDQKLATYSTATVGWAQNERSIEDKQVTTMDNPGVTGTNIFDWACYEYRGYGFKLYLMQGPEFGQCTVTLDGTQVNGVSGDAIIDCYAADDIGPQVAVFQQNVPLDFHRVQVNVGCTKNAAATGSAIAWHSLEVMR